MANEKPKIFGFVSTEISLGSIVFLVVQGVLFYTTSVVDHQTLVDVKSDVRQIKISQDDMHAQMPVQASDIKTANRDIQQLESWYEQLRQQLETVSAAEIGIAGDVKSISAKVDALTAPQSRYPRDAMK